MTVTPVEPTALGGGGALAQLPDTTRLRRLAEQAAQGCTAGVTAYSALRGGADGPAVAPALTAVGEVRAQATVDVSGLAEAVQTALRRITAAVPPAVRDEADALQRSYVAAREALLSHPLADLLPEAILGGAGFMDDLVLASAVLAQAFGGDLEPYARRHWSGSEDLRVVLRRYRSFFHRLLSA